MKAKHYSLLLLLTLLALAVAPLQAQQLPLLKVSEEGRHLLTEEGAPFFWLGGTAWELIHRLDREEIDLYLEDRASKGFTVIQTVILAELDGLNTPNAEGHKPLIDLDPTQLNEDYFQLVDYVVDRAAELGLYVGLLPTWGDKFNRRWGVGPVIFDEKNARVYGRLLGERYVDRNNLVWILGGDRIPESEAHYAVVEAMARGILQADRRHLLTYHPAGAHRAREYFHGRWLDMDMYQSGHQRDAREYAYALESRAMKPVKPVINGEARYENIRDHFWEEEPGPWMDEGDARISAWWSMMAGCAGFTYGCNDIWQMYAVGRQPTVLARTGWKAALQLPGATQMGHMRRFFEALPWQSLVPDQSLILNDNPEGPAHMRAARLEANGTLLVYNTRGLPLSVDLSGHEATGFQASWFNPRSGAHIPLGEVEAGASREFVPWTSGHGSDFVLVLKPLP